MAGPALLFELHEDPLAIVKALRQQSWFELAAFVEIAGTDIDPTYALTDPALYQSLRDAISLFHLKGCCMFDLDKLKKKAGMKPGTHRAR